MHRSSNRSIVQPSYQPRIIFSDARFKLVLAALLTLLTVTVYFPVLRIGNYVWDDESYVTENENLRTADGLLRTWLEPRSVAQYYPLVHSTFWLEYQLWKLDPRGYHLVNVFLHGLCALLLWKLLTRFAVRGALFAAIIFAVHPVMVESVAWITERKNVLSGVFYLGAMLAYFRYAQPEGEEQSQSAGTRFYWLAFALFVCALLSKTVTSTLPAAIVVIIWWKRGRVGWSDVSPLIPMFAVGAALGAVTSYLELHHVGAMEDVPVAVEIRGGGCLVETEGHGARSGLHIWRLTHESKAGRPWSPTQLAPSGA